MGGFEKVHAWHLIVSLLNKSKHHFSCLCGSFNSFVVAWAKVNLYRNRMTQSLPGIQYATGKQMVPTFLVRKGCIHYFVFAFVRADMTPPSEDRDLFMLYNLTRKKNVKV